MYQPDYHHRAPVDEDDISSIDDSIGDLSYNQIYGHHAEENNKSNEDNSSVFAFDNDLANRQRPKFSSQKSPQKTELIVSLKTQRKVASSKINKTAIPCSPKESNESRKVFIDSSPGKNTKSRLWNTENAGRKMISHHESISFAENNQLKNQTNVRYSHPSRMQSIQSKIDPTKLHTPIMSPYYSPMQVSNTSPNHRASTPSPGTTTPRNSGLKGLPLSQLNWNSDEIEYTYQVNHTPMSGYYINENQPNSFTGNAFINNSSSFSHQPPTFPLVQTFSELKTENNLNDSDHTKIDRLMELGYTRNQAVKSYIADYNKVLKQGRNTNQSEILNRRSLATAHNLGNESTPRSRTQSSVKGPSSVDSDDDSYGANDGIQDWTGEDDQLMIKKKEDDPANARFRSMMQRNSSATTVSSVTTTPFVTSHSSSMSTDKGSAKSKMLKKVGSNICMVESPATSTDLNSKSMSNESPLPKALLKGKISLYKKSGGAHLISRNLSAVSHLTSCEDISVSNFNDGKPAPNRDSISLHSSSVKLYNAIDNSNLNELPMSPTELAVLLSNQELQYGTNMYESLQPNDAKLVDSLVARGWNRERAFLSAFYSRVKSQPTVQASQTFTSQADGTHRKSLTRYPSSGSIGHNLNHNSCNERRANAYHNHSVYHQPQKIEEYVMIPVNTSAPLVTGTMYPNPVQNYLNNESLGKSLQRYPSNPSILSTQYYHQSFYEREEMRPFPNPHISHQ